MTGFGSWRTQAEGAVSIRVYSGGRCQISCVMVAGKSFLWLVSCQYSCVIALSIRVYPHRSLHVCFRSISVRVEEGRRGGFTLGFTPGSQRVYLRVGGLNRGFVAGRSNGLFALEAQGSSLRARGGGINAKPLLKA